MTKFEIKCHVEKTSWLNMLVEAKNEDEAKQKANDWEYLEIDDETEDFQDPGELTIDDVEVVVEEEQSVLGSP